MDSSHKEVAVSSLCGKENLVQTFRLNLNTRHPSHAGSPASLVLKCGGFALYTQEQPMAASTKRTCSEIRSVRGRSKTVHAPLK